MSETQLEFVATKLPQPKSSPGRPAYTNRELLPGILKVLRSGCRWRDLNLPDYPDGSTHWRRLQFWKRKQHFQAVWEFLLCALRKEKKLSCGKRSLDGSLIQSFAFKDNTGFSGKHKRAGTKISTIAEEHGIPIAMVYAKGNIVDITLAEKTIEGIHLSHHAIQGSDLLADKGYDSFTFRTFLTGQEIMPHIPKRRTTRVPDKNSWYYIYDRTKGAYRYVIERTNAWIKSFRRLRMRFDYKASSFEAFLYLAIIVICVRKLLS